MKKKSQRPRGRNKCLDILVSTHPWGRKEDTSWHRAPLGLQGVEERMFQKDTCVLVLTEKKWWGSQHNGCPLLSSHLWANSAEVFWQTECIFLVFSSTAIKILLLLAFKKPESHLRGSNAGKKKKDNIYCFINLVIKSIKIPLGKCYSPIYPAYLAVDMTYFLKYGYFDLAEPKW